jgi:phage terminase large subunit-like protein
LHNKQKALDVIEFIQLLHHTGDFYGQPFVLLDWQYEVIWNVYGTVKENGYRQYLTAYLEIAKKNGKTEIVAALAVYHIVNDGYSGQIYCCAAEKEQAGLTYKAAKQMIEQDEYLSSILKVIDSKKEIHNIETGTFIKVLSAEAYSKHGLNPTVVIFDELHAQPNRELWDVMTFGAGSTRKEPLCWVITTAGDDPDKLSIGWEKHEYARKVIDKEITDPTWYAKIYCANETDDIWNEATWYKANPSLGHTIQIETVRQEALTARNDPKVERLFRWLRLNQWVSVKRVGWLPLTLFDSSVGKWSIDSLLGKKCYLGLDLSSTTDLTASVLVFPPQLGLSEWRVLWEAWIPEDKMNERIRNDNVPFDYWVKEKFINATPGDCVDYEFIEARILAQKQLYKIKYVCADPWNSRMLTQRLGKKGLTVVEVPQTMSGMSPGMKEMERLYRSGEITHEHNPVARWCWGNVVVQIDGNENMKPDKKRAKDRIDITVAEIIAMNIAIVYENKKPLYEERGMRIL